MRIETGLERAFAIGWLAVTGDRHQFYLRLLAAGADGLRDFVTIHARQADIE